MKGISEYRNTVPSFSGDFSPISGILEPFTAWSVDLARPSRIDMVLDSVREYWEKHPELTLSGIITAAISKSGSLPSYALPANEDSKIILGLEMLWLEEGTTESR